ncbi:amidohydrolase family protein [Leifsonia sp. NPDC080035]|uniref:Amidohydrolase family protein n=1 Tax=Leifsonia sp. NPDC080035 TaxID=3143936 RepID=A0AAU7GJE0_9MICO
MLDVVITGAQIIDGTGRPAFPADLGIQGDRIVMVGDAQDVPAVERIDADGLIATPGLIDPHSHSDWSVLGNPEAVSTIRQGVTTEVVGNCGVTYAPLAEAGIAPASAALGAFGFDEPVAWRSFDELLEEVHGRGTSQNLSWFVGQTALRQAAESRSEESRNSLAAEQEHLLHEAMEAGAIGFSSGLEYGAGRFSTADELTELARIAARYDGIYASHIRNRDSALDAAVDEFFAIARAAGRAQLSHLNVRHNTGADEGAWHRAADRVVDERASGLDILADMTPYNQGIGFAVGLLPRFVADNEPARIARLLRDPDVQLGVREDSDRYWRFVHRGEWQRVRLGVAPATPELEGLSFPEIAGRLGTDEWGAFFEVLAAAGEEVGSVQLLGDLFTDEHLRDAIAHDHFLLGVDAYTSRTDGPLAERTRHPLFFYGHTHFLAHHVARRRTLTLEEAVRKMTSAVADHFGLTGRGRVRPGAFADLVLFDPARLAIIDTTVVPRGYADAARDVWVNGVRVVRDASHTGARPGRHLRRAG